ncbi:DUF4244 domain-containing protein [Kitasatospora azatica]|uniref:DUF4244 domain-containing protein n=1 Tax=Kitasatospora azatica TaxID=58347 RepID=UPI000AA228F9|nr:DUF4244 domain-containing protein [Kitasatospora azatica]
MNRILTDVEPVVTFVPFPPHDRSARLSSAVARPATVAALALRAVHLPAAMDGRPSRRESPPSHRRPRPGAGQRLRRGLRRLTGWPRRRFAGRPDGGMSTAEYAVGTVAACGFAALLYKVVTGGSVTAALTDLLDRALHAV